MEDALLLPKKLRTVRNVLGLSQEELASRLGVSFATVNRWEGGKAMPQKAQAEKLEELWQETQTSPNERPALSKGIADEPTVLLPRRLLPVDDLSEAINHEQNRLLAAVKRDEMVLEEQFLEEDWRVALIVGDPGLGKSSLLKQLEGSSYKAGTHVRLHLLKSGFNQEDISAEIERDKAERVILLFDGFDELVSSQVVPFYSAISTLLNSNPDVRIVVSSRTTFAQRYEGLLAGVTPRVYLLDRLSEDEITEYMRQVGVQAPLVERARDWFHLQRGTHIISVPRYLKYVCEYLNDPSSHVGDELPRLHVIFQSVVKRALGQEVSSQDMITNPWAAERVIAKLALIMEIAQVNSISHDELLTFFDSASSDLKTYFLTPQAFAELSERLLKFDGKQCSFLDREIQEFLASSEIARLPEPLRAVFTLCFDEYARILKPSWFNTLRFLFDRLPRLFADIGLYLLAASSVDGKTFYTLDEGFWTTAPRFRTDELPKDTGRLLFTRTLDYFRSTKFWLDYDAVFCLSSIYSNELEDYLNEWISSVDESEGNERVNQSNIARLIGELREHHKRLVPEDKWKKWLLGIACNKDSDLVAVRTVLWALRYFKDDSIIESVSSLTDHNDQFVNEALVQVCETINPEHPTAIALLAKLVKEQVAGSFRALMSVHTSSVLASIIKQIAEDEELLGAVLNELSHRSSRNEGTLPRLFSIRIDDHNLRESVRALVSSMMLRIGRGHRHEPELYSLCQSFSLNNEELLLECVRVALQESERDNDWSISAGLAYFLTPASQARVIQLIRKEFPDRFDGYFFTLLQGEVARRTDTNQSTRRRNVRGKNTPEEVLLPADLVTRLRGFKAKEDFRVVVELSQFLEEMKRTNKILSPTETAEVSTFISENVFDRFDPSAGSISLNSEVSHRSWRISNFLGVFGLGVQIFDHLGESSKTFRAKLIEYLPFASQDEKKWIRDQIGSLTKGESDKLCRLFVDNEALKVIKLENLLEISKQLYPKSLQEYFPLLVVSPSIDSYERRRMISAMVEGGASATILRELKAQLTSDVRTAEHIDNILIERFGCKIAAHERATTLVSKAGIIPKRRGGTVFSPSSLESEMWEKEFAAPLLKVSDPSWSDIYWELLEAGFLLAAKGEELITYADYLWDIVFKYTENLIAHRSYQPFIELEREVAKYFDLEGANWVQGKLAKLRNAYSMSLGKPSSFMAATLKYNSCLNALVSPIENSRELVQLVNDALKNEVGPWMVGAGRKLIDGAYRSENKQREVSIQRVMRGPLLEALNQKRHFNYSFTVIREPQIDDDRRTDMLISYGFVGPCVIELKLSSHGDLRSRSIRETESFSNLKTYMNGYRSSAGILVVLEDKRLDASVRQSITDAFTNITGLRTVFLELPDEVRSSSEKGSNRTPKKSGTMNRRGMKKLKTAGDLK